MDFDTLINIIILFLFLALPSIVRRRLAKKKMKAGPEKKKKVKKPGLFSLFGKISDQLQEFRRELERQAGAQKQKSGETIWDDLAEPPLEDPGQNRVRPQEAPFDPREPVEDEADAFVAAGREAKKRERSPEPGSIQQDLRPARPSCLGPGQVRSCRLRRAVIWAEILDKPVALRDQDGSFRN
ncbi:hypothetical protein [Desulfospira joergensenii]|uniref:hypothetical protein n=1 Tax=Desulfospira joergensenii TaxID=53329 RepID=UPI0003B3C164|nr:hypothetical protein [Desulfospira joergensenii]